MISLLRKKFVIITMSLMMAVFGFLFLAYYFYNDYWRKYDTAEMLEWFAESGAFSFSKSDNDQEWLFEELADGENPIIGLIVDKKGNVISKDVIGGNYNSVKISKDVINKILENDPDKYEVDKYVYSLSKIRKEKYLIVAMDMTMSKDNNLKIISGAIIIVLAIFILTLISFYLSKYVAEPARLALEREKQFISDASHELKTPLSAISINAQAIDGVMTDNIYINNIINESARMGRLLEKLLTLSKLEEDYSENKDKFSLSDICEEMTLTYESMAYDKEINYNYEIDDNIIYYGNADEIRQLITILIDNAIKNTNSKGYINIKCNYVKNNIIFSIVNSGKGISKEHIPHLFERFYTTDQARRNKSFGLGLSIAKAIVDRHEGKIEVMSEVNKETEFKVTL